MIDSIELVNWKTHRHTVMNFQSGVNVLIGVMGAGKSSVMDAISFALFGTFPALAHRRTSIEKLISSRPTREESAEVRLRFGAEGDSYTIIRAISRSGTTARLERNGAYLQAQPERVNEEIERLLKVDYDTFSRVVYSEQNRLAYFLEIAKGERKKQIDHMLGLDNFAKAEENCVSLINNVKGFVADEEKMLAGTDADELKKQLAALAAEKQKLCDEKVAFEEKAKSAAARIDDLNKRLATLKGKQEAKRKLSSEISVLQSRIATLQEEKGRLAIPEEDGKAISQRREEGEKSLASAEAWIKKLRAEHDTLARETGGIESKIAKGRKDKAEKEMLADRLKITPETLQEEKARIEAALAELLGRNAELRAGRAELAKWIGELGRHITKCPVCDRDLSQELKESLLNGKSEALRAMEAELAKSERELAEKRKAEKEAADRYNAAKLASEKIKEYANFEAALEELARQEEKAKRRLDELAGITDGANADKERLGKELLALDKELEAIAKRAEYEKSIAAALGEKERKSADAAAIEVDEKEIDAAQESIRKESTDLGDTKAKLDGCGRLMSNIDSQIADKAKQVANAEAMRSRIERKRMQAADLTKFRDALADTEALLRNQLVSSINSMMQNVWRELYPYADYAAIRLNASKDDYALEVRTGQDSTAWEDVDAIASGGERSIACLAMRIAMAMVTVPNLRWLILDEPTHNIDEKGISGMIEIFGSTLPKVVEQIFVITHDQELKNIASAKVYQLEREKEKNEPTTVREL
jgi:exonuclease SbcC